MTDIYINNRVCLDRFGLRVRDFSIKMCFRFILRTAFKRYLNAVLNDRVEY